MRAILIFIVATILTITLGCNYEYGSYGKDISEKKTTESVSENEPPRNKN